MRVKLAKDVPTFLRDLTEPAVRYRRPPPLIGTVVNVVGDPLQQKRNYSFKFRRCNQSGHTVYPCAMWCDVRWDAPANGEEITVTGYHTGRFGMHYLVLVPTEEDPENDPKNVKLREDTEKHLAMQEAIAARVRERAISESRPSTGKSSVSRPSTGKSSRGSRTPGDGFTPRYWQGSQAATEHRAYHSQEAIKLGLDPAGKQKTLDRLEVADDYWTRPAPETPDERLLRRYAAGHRPLSSSGIVQEELRKSRPSTRGSGSLEPIVSADYDRLAGEVGSNRLASGDGIRPSSRLGILRISSPVGDDGVLRPPSSRGTSAKFTDDAQTISPDGAGIRPHSRHSAHSRSSQNPEKVNVEIIEDHEMDDINDRPGSSLKGSLRDALSRPGTGSILSSSRPASRAHVTFSDAENQSLETLVERPRSVQILEIPESSPRSSESSSRGDHVDCEIDE
jgi:hypothetical protein